MCQKCLNLDFQNTLQELICSAKLYPLGSLKRNKILTQIIRKIYPLLRQPNNPSDADLMQIICFFLVKNLDKFDPNRGCLLTWLNSNLFFRRIDIYHAKLTQHRREIAIDSTLADDKSCWSTVIPDIPSREYGSLEILDRTLKWIQLDSTGMLRQTHLDGHPEINAQVLILLRLPSTEMPWREIAAKFSKPLSTLNVFYSRKCLPLLREFGKSEGFL
jgi:DNA-directed RNA polymerase specialized sigma24 family protein